MMWCDAVPFHRTAHPKWIYSFYSTAIIFQLLTFLFIKIKHHNFYPFIVTFNVLKHYQSKFLLWTVIPSPTLLYSVCHFTEVKKKIPLLKKSLSCVRNLKGKSSVQLHLWLTDGFQKMLNTCLFTENVISVITLVLFFLVKHLPCHFLCAKIITC